MSLTIVNRCDGLDLYVAVQYEDRMCDGNPPPDGSWAKAGWFRVPYFQTLPPPYPGAPPLTFGGRKEVLTGSIKRRYVYVHARAWDGANWVAGWGDRVPRNLPLNYGFKECIWYRFDPPLDRCWFLEFYSPTQNLTVDLHL
jgi:hypothetical protein